MKINKKFLVNTFVDLLKINFNLNQEKRTSVYIKKYLKQIGILAKNDKYGNLIARVSGIGESLLLTANMRMFEFNPDSRLVFKKDIIKTNGITILGINDKSGITSILEALKYIQKNKIKTRPLEIVFIFKKGDGSKGVFNLNYKQIKSKEGLALNSNGLGDIIIAAPFCYSMDIRIKGKSTHSGVNPEDSINALRIASEIISELKLGRVNKFTTNNIGLFKSGTNTSMVPGLVELRAEARSIKLHEAQSQVDIFNKVFKKYVRKNKAKLRFKSKLEISGYKYDKRDSFIQSIVRSNKNLNIKSTFKQSGEISSASIFAGKKMKIINISCGGKNKYSLKESIREFELLKTTEFLVDFLTNIK